jgi:hypothetical protein
VLIQNQSHEINESEEQVEKRDERQLSTHRGIAPLDLLPE